VSDVSLKRSLSGMRPAVPRRTTLCWPSCLKRRRRGGPLERPSCLSLTRSSSGAWVALRRSRASTGGHRAEIEAAGTAEVKPRYIDRTGQRFGHLTVIRFDGRSKHGHVVFECACDCGNTTRAESRTLKAGKTKSCGCLRQRGNQRRRQPPKRQPKTCLECGRVFTTAQPSRERFAARGARARLGRLRSGSQPTPPRYRRCVG
jgi:hypothetical protein